MTRATEARPRRRATLGAGLALALSLAPGPARAADWPIIQGTEVGQPEGALRPFGFIQVVGEGFTGDAVGGLRSAPLAPFDGQRPTFNATESGATWGVSVRRARPGLRGAIPGTDRRVSYFLLAELGTATIARGGPALTDAAITLSYVPGARLRVGQFKLPLTDEALESNPIAAEWINGSLVSGQLAIENEVRGGRFVGGSSGFRDVGVQAFDTFQWNKLALSYAVSVTNGHANRLEDDAAKDVSARTSLAWVFSGKPADPHRQELSVFAWGQRGERSLDEGNVQRVRSGAGVHLELEPVRVRAEVVYASGALLVGRNPPFPGQPIVVSPTGRAVGAYVQGRVRLGARLLVGVRYDELRRDLDDPRALRVFRSITPMVEYDVLPRVRLQANYERRWAFAPDGSADARTITAAMGDRVLAQATVIF